VLSSTNNFMVIVTNAVPAPVILAIEVTGTNAVLTWSAISNLAYRLEYLDDVTLTNWVASLPDVVAADDTASATNVTAGQPARFYRVQLLP
jgi:hypothetical protein